MRKINDKNSARQEWATPVLLFDALNAEFGFEIDACANESNAKLPRYWTPEQDALAQDWTGLRVFCNPPYKDIGPWLEKGLSAALACYLLPARTDAAWFAEYISACEFVDFFVGRVNFEAPRGVESSSNAEGSALLIMQGIPPCGDARVRFRAPSGKIIDSGKALERRSFNPSYPPEESVALLDGPCPICGECKVAPGCWSALVRAEVHTACLARFLEDLDQIKPKQRQAFIAQIRGAT
jgi:phage N-6-adenine-methyltransferase